MNALAAQPASVRTACPYCGVGCGVLATPNESGGVAIAGDPMHPANFGALCSKGAALRRLAEQRGLVAGQIIAIGDNRRHYPGDGPPGPYDTGHPATI